MSFQVKQTSRLLSLSCIAALARPSREGRGRKSPKQSASLPRGMPQHYRAPPGNLGCPELSDVRASSSALHMPPQEPGPASYDNNKGFANCGMAGDNSSPKSSQKVEAIVGVFGCSWFAEIGCPLYKTSALQGVEMIVQGSVILNLELVFDPGEREAAVVL